MSDDDDRIVLGAMSAAVDGQNATETAEAQTEVNMIVPPPIDYDPLRISLVPDPNIKYLDDVLGTIFEKFGMPRLGGASGRGWSSHSTFQRCPYLFKVKYLDRVRGLPALALETGSAFHTFLALHYRWMMDPEWQLTPQICKDELLAGGVRPQPVIEAWRLYEAYADHYQDDYLYPLAEEHWAEDPDGNTCRYDLIARVDVERPGIVPGAYIVEHKTAARFTADALEGWKNDGEILGQIMIWKRAGLDKQFGKLRGNIVNIVGKQRLIQFHRTIIPAQRWHVQQHMEDLKMWSALQQMYAATDFWPKARANCVTKFGMCDLFDHCAENRKPITVDRLKRKKIAPATAVASATDSAQIAPTTAVAPTTDSPDSSQMPLALPEEVSNMANAREHAHEHANGTSES